jgi:uncharacterized RDD family membrane protein YckC
METTYKIIGADGREYGPVSLAELKTWIHDGRLVGQTHVWRSDQTTWLPAAQYQELQPEIGQVFSSPAPAADVESEPVGFWMRVVAYVIDYILLNAIFYLIWGPSSFNFQPPPNINSYADLMPILMPLLKQMIVGMIVQMIYYVGMNGQFGATVGKLVIGARIVRLDGSRIGFGLAFLRWLATILSGLTCGIGYLIVAFREDKRALHDLIVGTQVIYRR